VSATDSAVSEAVLGDENAALLREQLAARDAELAARDAELAARDAELAARDAELAARDAELAARGVEVAELRATVALLKAQVEVLQEKLGQNSENSGKPPSSDGPGAASRGTRKGGAKGKTGRKRGGQKGHRGAHRSLVPLDQVHEFVHLFPEACEGCAASLPQKRDPAPRRYQLLELRVGGLHVKEWQRHEVVCERCGHRTCAPYDAELIPTSPFGPRLVAVVAMLSGVYHLSRRRTQQLLRELFGLTIALGTISAMEARASTALKAAAEEAQAEAEAAPVKHTDGTTWLLAGVTLSLWTLATASVTVYQIFSNGRRDTIRSLFGDCIGILVSDRADVFSFWAMALRQICHAHLIRKFVAFSQRDGPAGSIGRELLDLSALMFEYWHAFKAGKISRAQLEKLMDPVQRQFEAALERGVAAKIARLSGSCADILAHREALWTFVTHEGVEPTNNHAELSLRALVLWRRVSFGCQSERGLRFVERIMTVAQTARKQGKDLLEFIVRSVTAHAEGTQPPALLNAPA